jgi:hypothetical protein
LSWPRLFYDIFVICKFPTDDVVLKDHCSYVMMDRTLHKAAVQRYINTSANFDSFLSHFYPRVYVEYRRVYILLCCCCCWGSCISQMVLRLVETCRQSCPAVLHGSLARQSCQAVLPGSLAQQSCPAILPDSLAGNLICTC